MAMIPMLFRDGKPETGFAIAYWVVGFTIMLAGLNSTNAKHQGVIEFMEPYFGWDVMVLILVMALLGCDVVSIDQVEVLPPLMRNVERNTSRSLIMQMNPDADFYMLAGAKRGVFFPKSIGSMTSAELSWGNHDHIKALDPPFAYVDGGEEVYTDVDLDAVREEWSSYAVQFVFRD